MTDTPTLARASSLYRWVNGMSVDDLAELADVHPMKLIDLEIRFEDRLTENERRRLMIVVCSMGIPV